MGREFRAKLSDCSETVRMVYSNCALKEWQVKLAREITEIVALVIKAIQPKGSDRD